MTTKRTIIEINEKRTLTVAALKRLARMACFRHFDLHYYFYLCRASGGYEVKLGRRARETYDLVRLLLGEAVVDAVYEEAKARFIDRIGHDEWVDAFETDPMPEPPVLTSEK